MFEFPGGSRRYDAERQEARYHAERGNERGGLSRRDFLCRTGTVSAGLVAAYSRSAQADPPQRAGRDKALIAITLDLEMSRNFPTWETTHWDYEKGNLDADTKAYAVEAARRVKDKGGVIHFFCVGRVLEQEYVDWLKGLVADGHKVGNHTYDHVYVLATKPDEIQFRFTREPWLILGRPPAEVITDNIRMTNEALKTRIAIDAAGFRTPGGFAAGMGRGRDVAKNLLRLGC